MPPTGATYDTIEGRFRIIRKEAAKLKEEVDSGVRPEAPARGTPKKEKTLGGRVAKSVNATPTKKRGNATKGVKQEPSCNGESFASGGGDGGEADGGIMDAEGLDEFLNMGQEGY